MPLVVNALCWEQPVCASWYGWVPLVVIAWTVKLLDFGVTIAPLVPRYKGATLFCVATHFFLKPSSWSRSNSFTRLAIAKRSLMVQVELILMWGYRCKLSSFDSAFSRFSVKELLFFCNGFALVFVSDSVRWLVTGGCLKEVSSMKQKNPRKNKQGKGKCNKAGMCI